MLGLVRGGRGLIYPPRERLSMSYMGRGAEECSALLGVWRSERMVKFEPRSQTQEHCTSVSARYGPWSGVPPVWPRHWHTAVHCRPDSTAPPPSAVNRILHIKVSSLAVRRQAESSAVHGEARDHAERRAEGTRDGCVGGRRGRVWKHSAAWAGPAGWPYRQAWGGSIRQSRY